MLLKTPLLKICVLSFSANTPIKFDDNNEFTLVPQASTNSTWIFHVQDVKGDFAITRIKCQGSGGDIPYDAANKTFISGNYASYNYEFHIMTEVEFKKVGHVSVSHQLKIESARMKLLKAYEYYEECLVLDDHEYMKFKYFIKKIRDNVVEIVIENPMEVQIQGKTSDFKHEAPDSTDITLNLIFVFDPSDLKKSHKHLAIPKSTSASHQESSPNSDEEPSKKKKPTWHQIMSDPKFSDVILAAGDGQKIPSHRCVLAKYSEIFAKIFEESKDVPVKITIDGFNSSTIKAALDFCYGKTDSIVGKEAKLFEFANKYCIDALKEACCSYFEEKVCPKNVCEIVLIAYENGFGGLKQKCKKILVEDKEEVDSGKLKELPKEILFDIYCL